MSSNVLVTGARISNRGEDFLITEIVENHDGTLLIEADGISELVKGKRFRFDTAVDQNISVLNPVNTKLVSDSDYGYRKTKLFIETQLRNSSYFSNKITIAHKGAFNIANYQFEPTLKAFNLPRPRILIADDVGLGKTIEVGIFLAELIKRGKGKRILVLALKSILGQFQQEIWNRFAIPLVRLDSRGIAQIKTELPANKNPFEFYDKTIISIDTLKNNAKFRHYIEKSMWDIIVIDECHTVSNASSQRGDLAQFLSTRCESLVLTSATPHNGKKQSFANLIHMIEPTAIARSGKYTKADVEPYYVRRFKHHILDDAVRANFQDREIIPIHADMNTYEEGFLKLQQDIKFKALNETSKKDNGDLYGDKEITNRDFLFSIGLFKGYMSSPMAALKSLKRRYKKLESKQNHTDNAEDNRELITELISKLESIVSNNQDSKYTAFKEKLIELKWSGRKNDKRLVVFAERIDTIKYLAHRLTVDFNIAEKAIETFHGGLNDVEQQAIIDDFGKKDSDVRVLIASDAGSQGVNLHYFCNTMFNYDIPWSLITLEQRNGRIDRYGQNNTPYIYYLIGRSEMEGLKTDLHIIENLTKKEEEVYQTLGDAGSVMNLYNAKSEESVTTKAMANGREDFLGDFDLDMIFGSESDVTEPIIVDNPIEEFQSLYNSDYEYYQNLIDQLKSDGSLRKEDAEFIDTTYLEIKNTKELNRILYDIPRSAKPKKDGTYRLSLDKNTVQNAINDARKKKGEWSKFQMLYDLHPVVRFYMSKLEASVDKDVALAAKLKSLPNGTAWYVVHGQVANNLGQAVISDFFVVPINMAGGLHSKPISFQEFVIQFKLNSDFQTMSISSAEIETLENNLLQVVDFGTQLHMHSKQQLMQINMEKKSEVYEEKLKNWNRNATDQLQLDFEDKTMTGFIKRRFEDKEREIKTILEQSSQYFKDLTSLNQDAYLRIIAVFFNN